MNEDHLYVYEPRDLGPIAAHILATVDQLQHDGRTDAVSIEKVRQSIEKYARVRVRLVMHREQFDNSVHVAVLLPLKSGAVVSLAIGPQGDIPWPLRGVQRWSDQDLLRVNGRTLSVQQAIAFLDFLWEEHDLIIRLIDSCILEDALAEHPIELSIEDVQAAIDEWRKLKGLTTRKAMMEWLKSRGFSLNRFGRYVADELKIRRLRSEIAESLPADDLELNSEQTTDTIALIVEGVIPSAEEIVQTYLQSGRDGDMSRLQEFLIDGRINGARIIRVERENSCAEIRDQLQRADVGQVVGPVYNCGTATLARVLTKVELQGEELSRRSKEQRICEWLRAKRCGARIEWNWGPAETRGT